MIDRVKCCPICGFELYPDGRDAFDVMSCFEICPCCFCEFGFDDTSAYREAWMAAGCPFHSPHYRPVDWNPEKQLQKADYSWRNPITTQGPAQG